MVPRGLVKFLLGWARPRGPRPRSVGPWHHHPPSGTSAHRVRSRPTMLGKLALPEIRELIESGDDATLSEVVNRWFPADLAELLGALTIGE